MKEWVLAVSMDQRVGYYDNTSQFTLTAQTG